MADGGQLFNSMGGGMSGASANSVLPARLDSESTPDPFTNGYLLFDTISDGPTDPVLLPHGSQPDSFLSAYALNNTFSLSFPAAVTAESPALSTGKVSLTLNNSTYVYTGLAAGAAPAAAATPTLYKMRAYQTGAGIFEYWISSGTPQLTNPSGLPVAAGSVSVVAMKRPTQLVV